MALEVLAGPYNITAQDGTHLSSFGGDLEATYIQGLGLLGSGVKLPSTSGMWAVQLDGTAYVRTDFAVGVTLLPDLRRSRGYTANVSNLALYNFNWLAGRPDLDPWLTPVSGFFSAFQVVAPDRFLQFNGTGVAASPLYDGKTFTAEYVWTGSSPGGPWSASAVSATEVCIQFASGSHPQIRFYDVVQKKQSRPTSFADTFYDGGLWYVPKWDVFVAVKARAVYVLANAVRPASVSNPAFSPTPTAGEVSDVSVRVLGAQSEPCVGELINWSITAGGGSLTQTQSATDAQGYAHTGYVAPPGLAGSVTIHTDLEF